MEESYIDEETPLSLTFETAPSHIGNPDCPHDGIQPTLHLGSKTFCEKWPIDIRALVESAYYPGYHDILTCSCGVPGCDGIYEGILVSFSRYGRCVKWHVPYPLRHNSSESRTPNLSMYFVYDLGDITEYRQAIISGLQAAHELAKTLPPTTNRPQSYGHLNLAGIELMLQNLAPLINRTHIDHHFAPDLSGEPDTLRTS